MFTDLIPIGTRSQTTRSRLIIWVSILLAGLFLFLAMRRVDWAEFVSAVRAVDCIYLPLLFVWNTTTNWVRSLRWRILLTADRCIPAQNVFWANMAGYLANNTLPARAGEFVRAGYVSKENGIPPSLSLATGMVERVIDLAALAVLGSVSLSLAGILSEPLGEAFRAMSVIASIGLGAVLVLPYAGDTAHRIITTLPMLGASVRARVGGLLDHFLRGVRAIQHPARAAWFLVFTGCIWLMDGVGVIFLARALHLRFVLSEAFLLLAGLGLSSAIPSTPGYIGIYQVVAVEVLQPFGVSDANALAFAICLQVVNLLVVGSWGGIAAWRVPSVLRARTRLR
jgi:uncharacterized protein (TIRG00374 family)